ncbi:hypothetical protein HDG32_004682 [Paraburkholderia sp. CI2]|uniref:DUF4760 domain-containing protein n=1 Tax=Paraburkholderia sp. CI2 TaxID=2723093 RepID=UPI001622D643|nr:hypothetical protein [Paraburkholderia sp. CI2]MBB5468552.1 hypothetical protein [Paraburkholderia sp. CI2]
MFALGTVLGAYWGPLGSYLRASGIGDFIRTIAPVIGAVVAIFVLWWQANRARYTMRIDLILKLADRFDSPEMRKTRAKAARALTASEETNDDAVGDLLDFLEQIGFLLSRRAIDLDAVYEFFEAWIVPYSQKTASYRTRFRVIDDAPDLYANLDRLFNALTNREMRTTGKAPHRTPEQIDDFLKREAALSPKRLWGMCGR